MTYTIGRKYSIIVRPRVKIANRNLGMTRWQYRGFYTSGHVLLNFLNGLRKRGGRLSKHLLFFRNMLNKSNDIVA